MALAGKVGAIYKNFSTGTSFTTEATTANVAKTRYTITNTAKRYWDDTVAVTVRKDGVIQTTGFTIEYAGGVVVFAVALTAEVITVSGNYLTLIQCATFFNWKLDINADMKDISVFGDTWKKSMPIQKGWSVSADGYYVDSTFFAGLGTKTVIVLYVDSGASLLRYEGYVILKKNSVDTPHDDVIKESIDFEGDGQLYYREG